jgi:hypothetical protein
MAKRFFFPAPWRVMLLVIILFSILGHLAIYDPCERASQTGPAGGLTVSAESSGCLLHAGFITSTAIQVNRILLPGFSPLAFDLGQSLQLADRISHPPIL